MEKITQLNNEKVSFTQRDVVKEGVICDVYSYNESDNKDLGLVTVQPGCKTPNQKVLNGDKTLEGLFSGSGTLRITHVDGRNSIHEFNEESDIKEIEVMIGEQMQWEAGEDGLKFYEICYPPYKEGRFENLSDDNYYAEIIWDYMHLHHEMKKMDAIFILGSNDLRVADRAAELYHQGLGEYVICSGGNGKNSVFEKTEAEMFSERLIELNVPKEKILLESSATNTGDNIKFTKKMLSEKGFVFNSFILVQKPYMERRTYATFKKQWAEPEIIVTSPQLTFEEFTNDPKQKKHFNTMVGDLQRIKEYPKLGFQIKQDIPENVLDAWRILVDRGYKKYYIDDFDLVSFKLSEEFQHVIQKVYEDQSKIIHDLLGDIEIHHVGGTSIPGLLTKGDLDVNIRVAKEDFQDTIKKLKQHYYTAQISNWSDTFASFKDHRLEIDFGIQVCVIDSEDDHFLNHQQALLNSSEKVGEFNELKKSLEGKEMREYRIEKGEFLKSLL